MSDVGSGIVKLAYRGFAGFFVVLLMFIFGVVGVSLALAGGLVTALCWVPLAYPEILDNVSLMMVSSNPLTSADAGLATLALLLAGIVFLAAGFILLAITFIIGKAAIIVDKEVAQLVDKAFIPSNNDRLSQLERLANLRDQGVLTEEEFQREKGLLLGTQTSHPEGEPSKKFQSIEKD